MKENPIIFKSHFNTDYYLIAQLSLPVLIEVSRVWYIHSTNFKVKRDGGRAESKEENIMLIKQGRYIFSTN
jgi:hypothetical protein